MSGAATSKEEHGEEHTGQESTVCTRRALFRPRCAGKRGNHSSRPPAISRRIVHSTLGNGSNEGLLLAVQEARSSVQHEQRQAERLRVYARRPCSRAETESHESLLPWRWSGESGVDRGQLGVEVATPGLSSWDEFCGPNCPTNLWWIEDLIYLE